MAGQPDHPKVLEPARVYPAAGGSARWVVEAPVTTSAKPGAPHFFTGPHAQVQALRYAHKEFGGARFFPFPTRGRNLPPG